MNFHLKEHVLYAKRLSKGLDLLRGCSHCGSALIWPTKVEVNDGVTVCPRHYLSPWDTFWPPWRCWFASNPSWPSDTSCPDQMIRHRISISLVSCTRSHVPAAQHHRSDRTQTLPTVGGAYKSSQDGGFQLICSSWACMDSQTPRWLGECHSLVQPHWFSHQNDTGSHLHQDHQQNAEQEQRSLTCWVSK